jgi:glycosyltransferase involved in cell wall biosynthesis
MKILYLSSNLSNESGGYAESSFLLREKLDMLKNTDAYLFGFWKSKEYKLNYVLSDKISIFPAGLINIFPFSFSYLKKIFLIRPNLIDVQGLWSSASIATLIYNKLRQTPYIITPRGMLEDWALKQSYFKKLIFYLLIEKYHFKNATCLRATSNMEMNSFRKLGFKKKIINIPNAIKIPKIKLKTKFKTKKKKILFLSRIHKKKGISELLNAWKYIHHKYLDWELVICGFDENGYKNKMVKLSNDLKLKRVVWKDYTIGKEKDNLFKSSDLFILLSHSENFGLSIAEALSFGLPVITTTNTPWKDLKKYNCGWCIDLKTKKIIKTLENAICLNPKKRMLMGKRGRAWIIRDFSDKSIGIKMRSVYNWILKKGPKPKKIIFN